MRMRSFGIGILAALALGLGTGCKKSPPPGEPPQGTNQSSTLTPQSSTALARIHWLGKDRIVAQKSSAYLKSIWSMPEAQRLEAQTLDKLALAIVGDRAEEAARSGITNANGKAETGEPKAEEAKQKTESGKQKSSGTNRVAAVSNAEAQIAPGTAGGTNQAPTAASSNLPSPIQNPRAKLLRPLLEDLLRHECYLEIRQLTNQPAEVALAVRLDEDRAALWSSNLTAVLASATNVQPAAAESGLAWRLPRASGPLSLALARVGDWTVLGLRADPGAVAADGSRRTSPPAEKSAPTAVGGYATNLLLAEFSQRIRSEHTPVPAPGTPGALQMNPVTRQVGPAPARAATNEWLAVDADLRRVSDALAFGWRLPDAWPRISASWTGQGDHVRTAGTLTFAKPLDLPLEAWNIPTNLIHEPLVSFTALRGFRPWLAKQKWVERLKIDPVPDQLCAWAESAGPVRTYTAVPMSKPAMLLQRIGRNLASEANSWVATNALGEVKFSNDSASITWFGFPMFTPKVQPTATGGGEYLLGRLGPEPTAGKLAPPELFAQLTGRSNVVYYQWEITGLKLHHWLYISQTARLVLVLPQMDAQNPGFDFLLAVAPRLGNSGTEIHRASDSSLEFIRNSQLGFTAPELHFIADWLDSPNFPEGLHSFAAPRPVRKYLHPPKDHPVSATPAQTNAVPAKQ